MPTKKTKIITRLLYCHDTGQVSTSLPPDIDNKVYTKLIDRMKPDAILYCQSQGVTFIWENNDEG